MKITRKTTLTVKTVRQFITRQLPETETVFCQRCAEPLIPAQKSADFFGISSRAVYRLIESGRIHFVEIEANDIYVCPVSIKRVLELIRLAD